MNKRIQFSDIGRATYNRALIPQEDHVDAGLSADANSTCIRGKQGSLPHTVPNSDLPLAGLQECAKLPATV